MRLQDFISSGPVTRFGLFVGRYVPRRVGHGLAWLVANLIARRRPEVYWTVQANLRQVVGPEAGDGALHEMARQAFFHAGQTYYDFFHAVGQPREVLAQAVHGAGPIFERITSEAASGRGVLLLATHMSNFDLGALALTARGLAAQVLSLADPGAGFRLLNLLRGTEGLDITPITPASLRAAAQRLKDGGLVITGVDRPVPRDRELIEFFGRPAYLPTGPARMAMVTGAAVYVGGCYYDSDLGYVLEATGPVEMARTGDRRRDILANTRRLAAVLEGYVRAHPEQWMMFHPFWPDRKPFNQGG